MRRNVLAVIKGISNDIFYVETYCPESVDNFSLNFRVQIGLDYTQWADDFELLLATKVAARDSMGSAVGERYINCSEI